MNNLYLLITIIRRSDSEEYESFYESDGVGIIYTIPCNGTAHAKTLDLFGLEKTEKSMLMSVVTETSLKSLCKKLSRDMKIDLPDRGVAMAVPLSGIAGARTLEYFTATQETQPTDAENTEEKKMQSDYELIVAIYEKGYTEAVMDAARAAGAGGGTTIRAKGTGAGAQKFFGLTLAEEKEMVFIVSSSAKKKDIMKAIIHDAGPDSKAHALVFSLPVSETAGFRFADTIEKD